MRKQYKAYIYGFKYNEEYKRYRELCKKKNRCFSYTDWYQNLKEKYKSYSFDRLWDFEKYLNWKVYKLKRMKEFIEFAESMIKTIMGIILPAAALFVSIMTYVDGMQVSLLNYMRQDDNLEGTQKFLENAKVRGEVMADVIEIVERGIIITVGFTVALILFSLAKRKCRDEARFIEDYKECVGKIREEKSS